MKVPQIEDLTEHHEFLAAVVARTSWLPHPKTVAHFNGAVFPTLRYKRGHERFTHVQSNGTVIGMYDDNATPEWALFWSHGLTGVREKGWTIAHVWPASDDIHAYTHLANLAMIPEPFASLTDKKGPLTAFLRWHSWQVYGWKPRSAADILKPSGYDSIKWRYLEEVDDPKALIRQQLRDRKNERVRILQPIMANDTHWHGRGRFALVALKATASTRQPQIPFGNDKPKSNGECRGKGQYRGLSTAHHKNKGVILRSR